MMKHADLAEETLKISKMDYQSPYKLVDAYLKALGWAYEPVDEVIVENSDIQEAMDSFYRVLYYPDGRIFAVVDVTKDKEFGLDKNDDFRLECDLSKWLIGKGTIALFLEASYAIITDGKRWLVVEFSSGLDIQKRRILHFNSSQQVNQRPDDFYLLSRTSAALKELDSYSLNRKQANPGKFCYLNREYIGSLLDRFDYSGSLEDGHVAEGMDFILANLRERNLLTYTMTPVIHDNLFVYTNARFWLNYPDCNNEYISFKSGRVRMNFNWAKNTIWPRNIRLLDSTIKARCMKAAGLVFSIFGHFAVPGYIWPYCVSVAGSNLGGDTFNKII